MNEILDDIGIKSNQKIFSKLSLITSLITLGLMGYIMASIPTVITANEDIPQPSVIVVTAIQFFCLIGLISTALSFIKKESSTWYKWVGGILNILFFVLIGGSVFFFNVMI